jgi:hypothetical protein
MQQIVIKGKIVAGARCILAEISLTEPLFDMLPVSLSGHWILPRVIEEPKSNKFIFGRDDESSEKLKV